MDNLHEGSGKVVVPSALLPIHPSWSCLSHPCEPQALS